MVAKAAWLVVEPEINLASYLASEEPCFLSCQTIDSLSKDDLLHTDELEDRAAGEDPSDD